MSKKIIMACMAIAALAAFALPASALAANEPQLTENGSLVAKGSLIKVTNIGDTILKNTEGASIVNCSTATMTGEVTKNEANTVEGKITTATFAGTGTKQASEPDLECTGSLGNATVTPLNFPWTLKSTPLMANDELQVAAAAGKIKFLLKPTVFGVPIECEYEANGVIKGSFVTNADTASVTASSAGSGFTRIRGEFPCPTSGYLEMNFTTETDVAVATPVTIS
jgi:hypothetical protein